MIIVLNKIQEIKSVLEKLKSEKSIIDYKIILKINLRIHSIIFVEKKNLIDLGNLFTENDNISTEIIEKNEMEFDDYYKNIFQSLQAAPNDSRIDLGIRRRFSHLINFDLSEKTKVEIPFPLVTFYSYKGGMGRSTALASFASHYAMHHKKRVLIIDCDWEAPGFTNYFDLTLDVLDRRSGIVEYLVDRQYEKEPLDLSNYIVEIDKIYSQEGAIYVMPAGNLSENLVNEENEKGYTHREHYLEALARLDISSSSLLIKQFSQLLADVAESFIRPDIVLIDSRTGFNDVFGVTAFGLSDLVVGFFGNNNQTKPGLYYFLDAATKIRKKYNVMLVNSILPNDDTFFQSFKTEVENHLAQYPAELENEENSSPILVESYPINRHHVLEKIGTYNENKSNFIKLISSRNFADYEDLFEGIANKIQDIKTIEIEKEAEIAQKHILTKKTNTSQNETKKLSIEKLFNLKRSLLEELSQDYLEPYAENILFDESFLAKKFYFRPAMSNIFNRDKYLIIGGKGTGKTSLYKALQTPLFVNKLKERAGKATENYITTALFSLQNDIKGDRKFRITGNFDLNTISNLEIYFKRFWLIYVWNVIMTDIEKGKYLTKNMLDTSLIFGIENTETTKQNFVKRIADNDFIIKVESDLKLIDLQLKKENQHLILLFDQLDFVVKPIDWDKCIAPLINYFRGNPFTRIYPKIFIRTDLFNKLGNVTNKQELSNQNIDIEWTQEEIFAFFFKWVLSSTSGQFHNLIKQYADYPPEVIANIKAVSENGQVPTTRGLLEPYVNSFFGKYASRENQEDIRFGMSYDWFYTNLKNADDTISLRPFLDLIKEAISFYLSPTNRDKSAEDLKPILSAFYYCHPNARKKAVKRHFEDLADEEGNRDLKLIFDYIAKLPPSHPFKKSYFRKREFDTLLSDILTKLQTSLENQAIDKLKELLIVNGIVAEVPVTGAYLNYRFAFLYKYSLGLK